MSRLSDQSLPRRGFLRGHFLNALQSEQIKRQGHAAIRPPWSDSANFLAKCTACDKCVTACETRIIVRGAGGYPEVDFTQGECTFCAKCAQVCEADLFGDTEAQAWRHKVEVTEDCLLARRIECRSCGDGCESRAIRFRPALGGIASLVLDLESCNGCGACLSLCPASAIKILNDITIMHE